MNLNLNTPIDNIMTREVITVNTKTKMSEVAQIFNSYNIHHIPVVDDEDRLRGILSQQDYCQLQDRFAKLKDEAPMDQDDRFLDAVLAEEVMSTEIVQLSEDSPLKDALEIFKQNKVHSIVVVKDEICKGIITPLDILNELK